METQLQLLREQNDLLKQQLETISVESRARLQRLTTLEEKVDKLMATVDSQGRQLSMLRMAMGADGTDSTDSV